MVGAGEAGAVARQGNRFARALGRSGEVGPAGSYLLAWTEAGYRVWLSVEELAGPPGESRWRFWLRQRWARGTTERTLALPGGPEGPLRALALRLGRTAERLGYVFSSSQCVPPTETQHLSYRGHSTRLAITIELAADLADCVPSRAGVR